MTALKRIWRDEPNRYPQFSDNNWQAGRQTDGTTDGRTDRQTRPIDRQTRQVCRCSHKTDTLTKLPIHTHPPIRFLPLGYKELEWKREWKTWHLVTEMRSLRSFRNKLDKHSWYFLLFRCLKKKEHRQNMYGKYYNRIPPQLIRGSHPSQHPVSRNHSARGNTNQINKNKIW